MVGRLPADDYLDGTPPPPYPDGSPSLILAETRTTRTEVMTTTETTTHFVTFPIQRVAHNVAQISNSLQVEKTLPPTPVLGSVDNGDRRQTSASTSMGILAHTALRLGLSHSIPHNSVHPQVNIVALASATPSNSDSLHRISSSVRRSKSSQKLIGSQYSPTCDKPRRRSRGLSFGAVSFLPVATTETARTKEKEKEEKERGLGALTSSPGSPRGLTRRASTFWSRKEPSQSLDSPPLPSTSQLLAPTLPPLPQLPSVSTFDLNDLIYPSRTVLSAGKIHPSHSRGLSRSHSDKLLNGYRPSDPDSESPKIRLSDSPTSIALETPEVRQAPQSSRYPLPPLPVAPSVVGRSTQAVDSPIPQPLLRPRAQTNPPFLHRLSMAMFSTSNSSSTGSLSNASAHSPQPLNDQVLTSKFSKDALQISIPRPLGDAEPPDIYVSRLRAAVSKAEMAGILASSSDPFYVKALRTYIRHFNFHNDPLDIALRKLLMEVGLPRETQQIDRVIEAFAFRYLQCNPDLFLSDDHPYILAFSLIMLHTDAFNQSNRKKMTRADYIKNTKLPGVSTEVLGCFYDNITFAPFIFIEDPLDINGQIGLTADGAIRKSQSPLHLAGGGILGKNSKIDPYYLIANNLLESLRVNVECHIPLENPFLYEGTTGSWDDEALQLAFSKANVIEVETPGASATFFDLSVPGDAIAMKAKASRLSENTTSKMLDDVTTLKVTKVGLLSRKDDVSERGKKVSIRKWRTWSVILTGSQLLFFRDSSLALNLLDQCRSSREQVILPRSTVFKPDELLSVKDSVAVFDKSYVKYENTFRFALADGRQLLLQAPNGKELNEWLSRINYASAFKSAGVRMRPLGMSKHDVQLTGVAAATSHLHDLQLHAASPVTPTHPWDADAPRELMGMLSGDSLLRRPLLKHRVTLVNGRDVDLDLQSTTEIANAEQFEATFKQVKADLANDNWTSHCSESLSLAGFEDNDVEAKLFDPLPASPTSSASGATRPSSRSNAVERKLQELESKLTAAQTQLDADMRLIRNITILRPFQTTTRSRLTAVVQSQAKRITLLRLDVTRLACHLAVLRDDLEAEGRTWNQSKRIALRAARQTLQRRQSENLPRMTLSLHDDALRTGDSSPDISCRTSGSALYLKSNSSTSESFHSAVDFGSDWPSDDPIPTSPPLNTSQIFDSPRPSFSASSSSCPFPGKYNDHLKRSDPQRRSSVHSTFGSSGTPAQALHSPPVFQYSERDTEDEQAEAWNMTRCAQRVSLIQVPSDIYFTSRPNMYRKS